MSLVADGPAIIVSGAVGLEQGEALRDGLDDLIGVQDDQMPVGDQGERPSALVGPGRPG